MGYLICQECGGYYKLDKGESKEDFVSCECYGSLTYVEYIDDYLTENNKSNKDFPENIQIKSGNGQSTSDVKPNNLLHSSDSTSENVFEGVTSQKNENGESSGFSYFRGSEENSSVKNRAYYREISSKEIKPDIKKLKLIKDVNGIIEALNYNDPEVKLESVQALGAMGDERALKHLAKLKNEEKGILKTYAENAISHIESKNKGFKSKNRAYYQKEYNKETARKSLENKQNDQINKPIDQTINNIKERTSIKTPITSDDSHYDDIKLVVKGSAGEKGTVSEDKITQTQDISETKNIFRTNNPPGAKDTHRAKAASGAKDISRTNNASGAKDTSGIKGVPTLKDVSATKDIPETGNGNMNVKMTKGLPVKTDNVNKINQTEGINDDDNYFIQFLGIKNTDKPLIGFIFLFIVFLGMGVVLTMGYK